MKKVLFPIILISLLSCESAKKEAENENQTYDSTYHANTKGDENAGRDTSVNPDMKTPNTISADSDKTEKPTGRDVHRGKLR